MADEERPEGQSGEPEGFDFDKEWERAQAEVAQLNQRFAPQQRQQAPPQQDEEEEFDLGDEDEDEPPRRRRQAAAVDPAVVAELQRTTEEAKQYITRREEARAVDRIYETLQPKMTPTQARLAKDMLDFDGGLDRFKESWKRVEKLAASQDAAMEEERTRIRRETLAEAAQRGIKPITTPDLRPTVTDKTKEALTKLDETGEERYLDEYIDRVADGFMGYRTPYRD